MARVLLNPTFSIETGELLSHDGEFHVESFPIRCDRGAQSQAKTLGQQANSTAGGFGSTANQIGSSIIPGLEQEATHPTGYTPVQKNQMLVAGQQAAGGANAAITGEGDLAALRSRTAGGYAPALAEAARAKGRQLSNNALNVNLSDAQLAQQRQQQAQNTLASLYGTTSSDQLKAMGLSDEDLQTQLAAGRQGGLQNTLGVLGTVSNMGLGAAKAAGFN